MYIYVYKPGRRRVAMHVRVGGMRCQIFLLTSGVKRCPAEMNWLACCKNGALLLRKMLSCVYTLEAFIQIVPANSTSILALAADSTIIAVAGILIYFKGDHFIGIDLIRRHSHVP